MLAAVIASKKFVAFLMIAVAAWMLLPLADFATLYAQNRPDVIPPPPPGWDRRPDDVPLSGMAIAMIFSLFFGVWRIRARSK